jgi:sterol 3beta-glucosyltransferase
VTLAASADAAGLIAGTDARFVPMDLDLRTVLESEEGRRWLAAGDIVAFMAGVAGLLSAARSSIGESVLAAADRCDVLVTSSLIEDYAYAAAQARNVPIVPMFIYPLLATSEYPHPMMPQDVPQDGQDTAQRNLETFRMAEEFYWRGARDDINDFRRSLGLDPAPYPMLGSPRIPELGVTVLQAFSGEVVRRPADWGPQSVLTGYWRLPGEVRRRIGEAEPEDLAGWLAAGPPPVFIGFGSMPVLEPENGHRPGGRGGQADRPADRDRRGLV